jgi:hypothetical protein
MSSPFHQHLFDFMPLLEQKLVFDLVVVIRECKCVDKSARVRAGAKSELRRG